MAYRNGGADVTQRLSFFAVPSERLESPMPDHRVVGPDPFNPLAPAAPEGGLAVEAQEC
ncbi:MAG: hypothetical protein R3C56_00455 [Pirellulaceae bacterium]